MQWIPLVPITWFHPMANPVPSICTWPASFFCTILKPLKGMSSFKSWFKQLALVDFQFIRKISLLIFSQLFMSVMGKLQNVLTAQRAAICLLWRFGTWGCKCCVQAEKWARSSDLGKDSYGISFANNRTTRTKKHKQNPNTCVSVMYLSSLTKM